MIEGMLLVCAALAWLAFMIAMNVRESFWQALIVAVIVFAALFVTAYFELDTPFIIICAILFVALLILTIAKSLNKHK